MAGQRTVAATYVGAIAIDSLGALTPWSGGVTLPKPSAFAATWTLWFLLGLVAAINARMERVAGQFSVLVLASMVVLGPYGDKFTTTLTKLGALFAPAAPSPAAAPAGGVI